MHFSLQVLFSAFDGVLTRAGGGTVNDALAHGVPMFLVEEGNMWQVQSSKKLAVGCHILELDCGCR